ncbi:hypothetical protein JCM19237_1289 [Photobacterium aphoticum]|uniref:Uncharacterized protein n=1 Tax=Photobacterium aphoticum TaxID=754436 RepID=A0A090RAL0_9GAMM|nr:hypothetical protein JCM19237_1289 [Photobacterium aphoticum]
MREQQLWIRSNPPLWRSYAVWQATDWTAVGDRLKAAFSAVPEAQRFVGVGAVLLYSLDRGCCM